ncbi:MAG TPA: DNA-formamidopyrimidine glycosylase family protein [Gemmatimonadales bacterium]
MPELPDIALYLSALEPRIVGQPLVSVTLRNPFILRSVEPRVEAAIGRRVRALRRIGKRIVFDFGDGLFLVIHLMIAGRFRWAAAGAKGPGRSTLAAFDFPSGRLSLTEAGTRRRASLHMVQGEVALRGFDRGGLDVLTASSEAFAGRLRLESHTLKRALTDPRLFDGIGNAYSDEILHAARLSPLALTGRLTDEEVGRLHRAARETLRAWTNRLREEAGEEFPEKVTAFRDGMAVHGRFGRPCPVCGSPVQRIRYADNETNYCARCQTGGRLLADRALSRLLRTDWPRSLDDSE